MPRIIIVVGFFLLSFCSLAQIATPPKTKLNIGLYGGLSIWKYRPMLALDLSYKGSTLRIMPNYRYTSVGFTQELLKISPVFYNLYWTASVYGGYGYEYDSRPLVSLDEYKRYTYTGIVNTGLKTYFAKRWYTHIMAGVMYNRSVGGVAYGVKDATQVLPYFEFGIGIQLLKNYPKLKSEETQE